MRTPTTWRPERPGPGAAAAQPRRACQKISWPSDHVIDAEPVERRVAATVDAVGPEHAPPITGLEQLRAHARARHLMPVLGDRGVDRVEQQ